MIAETTVTTARAADLEEGDALGLMEVQVRKERKGVMVTS